MADDLSIAIGTSDAENPADAGAAAAEQAADDIDDADLVYVFSGSDLADGAMLAAVDDAFDAPIVGCSTGGEIFETDVQYGSVVLMALSSDELEVGVGRGTGISDGERDAGKAAAEAALEDLDADGDVRFSVFSTTLTGNGSDVMRGVRDVIGEDGHATGGMAGDDWDLEETYVYHGDEVVTDGLVVAAVTGPHRETHGIHHGLEKTGDVYEVTSSDANIVHELDGRPTIEVYRELFGEKANNDQFLMTKPLGIEVGEEEPRLRDPLIVQDDGSIVYAAEVQEGSKVYMMESPPDQVIEAAKTAAREAVEAADAEPDEIRGAIMHDCVCRWNCLLDDETRAEEMEAVKEVIGGDVPVIGWYTYGEIALPRALAGVHNQTLVLQLFTE